MDHAHPMIAETAFGKRRVDRGFVSDEVKSGDFFVGLKCPLGAFDDDPAAVVTTHDIHCDSHKDGSNAANWWGRAPSVLKRPP